MKFYSYYNRFIKKIEDRPILKLIVLLLVVAAFGKKIFYLLIFLFLIRGMFYYSSVLGILIISGLIKTSPVLSDLLPINFTLLYLLIFLIHTFFFTFIKHRNKLSIGNRNFFCELLISFVFTSLIPIIFSPVPILKNSIIQTIFFYIPVSLIILSSKEIGLNSRNFIKNLANTLLNISVVWIGLAIHNRIFDITVYSIKFKHKLVKMYYLSAFGESYMHFSSFLAIVFIYVIILLIKEYRKEQLLKFLMCIILILCMFSSPARSLTLGIIVTTLFLIFSTIFNTHSLDIYTIKKWSIILISVFIFSIVIIFLLSIKENIPLIKDMPLTGGINRLSVTTGKGTIDHRIFLLKNTFIDWIGSPFLFLGSGYVESKYDYYVHNIPLEIIFEYGIFGLSFLIYYMLIIYLFVNRIYYSIDKMPKEILWIISISIVFFIFSMTSNTLGSIKIQLILFALGLHVLYQRA